MTNSNDGLAEADQLTPTEIGRLRRALAGTRHEDDPEAEAIERKLRRRRIWLSFTLRDLELLHVALRNGAPEDDSTLGMTPAEVGRFCRAANRIHAAGRMGGPRF